MDRKRKKSVIPSYCKHASGQAYVRLNNQFRYLGKHGSARKLIGLDLPHEHANIQ